MNKLPLVAIASIATVLLLAGCSNSSGTSASDQGSRAVPAVPGAPVQPEQATSAEGMAEDGTVPMDAQVITTGWVSLSVSDPVAAGKDAVAVVEKRGGHIDNRSEQARTDSQPASAQLTIRVPEDEVTPTLDELKELGTADSVSISSTDVTAQTTDLDARITAMQGSVSRLLDLMNAATDMDDLIALESAISSRQADLDSLTSQRDMLGDQVAYSTIDLQLVETGTTPAGAPKDFVGGLAVGWNTLVAAASGLVVALGVALPWLIALAVLAAIIVSLVRLAKRRRSAAPAN